MYEVGPWKVNVPGDVEIYAPPGSKVCELIPHSQYGYRFKHDATPTEKSQLVKKAGKPGYMLQQHFKRQTGLNAQKK